jgi:dephospho-CoA kinase
VHPLVREARREFLAKARASGAKVALIDIPLLFETAGDEGIDKIVVVTAPLEVQRERVLSRPGMSEEKFQAILARQLPDGEKRKRADFVIDTSKGFDAARENVRAILRELLAAE